jgi:hypothetical protein
MLFHPVRRLLTKSFIRKNLRLLGTSSYLKRFRAVGGLGLPMRAGDSVKN